MRKLLLLAVAFLMFTGLAAPAFATTDTVTVVVTVNDLFFFEINSPTGFTITYDAYGDFGVAQDLGDIDYDLHCNDDDGWTVTGKILDGTQDGQEAGDWDDTNWTLSVDGDALNETTATTFDGDTGPEYTNGGLWEVLLTIPWPEPADTYDCTIECTATNL